MNGTDATAKVERESQESPVQVKPNPAPWSDSLPGKLFFLVAGTVLGTVLGVVASFFVQSSYQPKLEARIAFAEVVVSPLGHDHPGPLQLKSRMRAERARHQPNR